VDTRLERLKARDGHGFWEESPDLDAADVAAVTSFARYIFAKGLGINGWALDIGCGKCYGGRLLTNGCTVVNFDLALESLIYGRRHFDHRGTFICGDAVKLPFQDETFDLITALEVVEHVAPGKTRGFLKGIKRVIKRGGRIVISTPNDVTLSNSGVAGSPFHVNNFTPSRFKTVIEECLGPAEFYGLAPNYGTIRNLFRKADVFNFRYVLKKWFGFYTVEDRIKKTPVSAGIDLMAEALARADKMFRITKGGFKRGQSLIAVFKKEG
jgi:SAM-dependent methyltransferase